MDAAIDLRDAMVHERVDARVIAGETTCGEQHSQGVIEEERPVDVAFIIDNSCSMGTEIEAVERNVNENFAQIIEASGADYRVIMLTDHGSASLDVCVEPPLAGLPCTETTNPAGSTAGAPANTARFFHYDINVQSWDSVCLMLQHYLTDPLSGPVPETGGIASPTGWNEWLREGALKVFVEISDDRVSCSAAVGGETLMLDSGAGPGTAAAGATRAARAIDGAILGLSTAQFGTAADPNYIWHSIVGIGDNDPVELPYTHFDPPQLDRASACTSAVNTGPAYQMLSIGSGGLRYPVCAADEGHGYDSVFRAIAHEVVRGAHVDCSFNIPKAPPGKFVDYESVLVEYTPGGGGTVEQFSRVQQDDCHDAAFYFDQTDIKLCQSACERVRGDASASVDVVFQCGPEVEFDPDLL